MTPDQDCPRCWVDLEPVLLTGPASDLVAARCPECRGLFLSPDEIAEMTGHESLGPLLADYLDFDYDGLLVCPACGNQMEAKDAAGVEVDVCMACQGVWLDRGELTMLRRADPAAFVVADDHDDRDLDEATRERIREVVRRLQKGLGEVRDTFRALAPGQTR